MSQSTFDKAALYLLAYSGTLSFSMWKEAVISLYKEYETNYGTLEAKKMLSKTVAYYCMEIGGSYSGRNAIVRFRKIHMWPDFRKGDLWWKEEWGQRLNFDKRVQEIRVKVLEIESIPYDKVHFEPKGREALNLLVEEAKRRHKEYVTEETKDMFRSLISIYGGHSIISLYRKEILSNWKRIPTMLTSYFIERELVAEYGEALISMKEREYR